MDYGDGDRERIAGLRQKCERAAERGGIGAGVPGMLPEKANGGFTLVLRLRAGGQAQGFCGTDALGGVLFQLEKAEIGRGNFGGAPGSLANGRAVGKIDVLAHFAQGDGRVARGGGDEELL